MTNNIAYIIGNGPSLLPDNLDKLIGKPSYACNRIHLMYEYTDWRPTEYVRSEWAALDDDPVRWKSGREEIQLHLDMGIRCRVSNHWDLEGIDILKHCHEHQVNYDDKNAPSEWHLPQPCVFGGSMSVAMQLAYMDGFKTLVLLGCDLNYRNGKPNHFTDKYELGGETDAFYANKNALWGHVVAINTIARKGLDLFVVNATRGGDLHLYPRWQRNG